MTQGHSPPRRWDVDRQLGWLISLGGCILVLDQTVFAVPSMSDFAGWWNAAGWITVAMIILLGAVGLVAPPRMVTTLWLAVPVVYVSAQATWAVGYIAGDVNAAVPWTWTLEPAVVTLLILMVRPGMAVGLSLCITSIPAISGWVLLGSWPTAVVLDTPRQLANVVYVVIFLGVRHQLNRLASVEEEARLQQRRQAAAHAAAEQHAEVSRLIHDEVLSVLSTAMHTEGTPSLVLRDSAARALSALNRSVGEASPVAEPMDTWKAAEVLRSTVATISDNIEVNSHVEDGTVRTDVVVTMSLAMAEAVRNSVSHAGADAHRCVDVHVGPTAVSICVADDGAGFTPGTSPGRFGVTHSIEGRMAQLGGSSTIRSRVGNGTEVTLSWST